MTFRTSLAIRQEGGEQPLQICLLRPGHVARGEAEAFIAARYSEVFGSAVKISYPELLVLRDEQGRIAAAVGLRRAAGNELFLEQYLDRPVEAALARLYRRPVARRGIVELGSFAARSALGSLYLIGAMSAFMERQGFEHALVTSTDRLRRLFGVFPFQLSCLCEARKDQLRSGGAEWGRYYDHAPRVLAGSVDQCFSGVRQWIDQPHNGARAAVLEGLVLQARCLA